VPADVLRGFTPEMPTMPAHVSGVAMERVTSFNNFSAADLASAVGEWDLQKAEAEASRAAKAVAERMRMSQQCAASSAVQQARTGRVGLMSKFENRSEEHPEDVDLNPNIPPPPSLPQRSYTTDSGRNSYFKPHISNGAGSGVRRAAYL